MSPTEQGVRIAAPAKINLAVTIGPRRGRRHLIDAPSVPIDLCDRIDATAAAAIGSRLIGMQTPADELAARAVAALAAASGTRKGLDLVIQKRIPAGAGLGGASSDAAAALIAANRLWNLNWPPAQLTELAGKIGSDVAFFIGCRPAKITGTGERIEPLAQAPSGWCVLVLPRLFCSTAAVYAHHASRPAAPRPRRRTSAAATICWLAPWRLRRSWRQRWLRPKRSPDSSRGLPAPDPACSSWPRTSPPPQAWRRGWPGASRPGSKPRCCFPGGPIHLSVWGVAKR